MFMSDFTFSLLLFLFDAAGTLLIGYLLAAKHSTHSVALKSVGVIAMFGILYQAVQCLGIVLTGVLPKYTTWPFWLLKDVAIVSFAVLLLTRRKKVEAFMRE